MGSSSNPLRGVGENRLKKTAQSSRLESPLPVCVSHQLLTSRADSPLWRKRKRKRKKCNQHYSYCFQAHYLDFLRPGSVKTTYDLPWLYCLFSKHQEKVLDLKRKTSSYQKINPGSSSWRKVPLWLKLSLGSRIIWA